MTTGQRTANYHYYACSGRQKLGRRGCEGDSLSRDKLEAAVLGQLAELYRDEALIRQAIEHAAANEGADRAALAEQRAGLAKEISRAERAIERYHQAFEAGDLDPKRYDARVSALDARLETLSEQDRAPAHDSPHTRPRPPTPPSSPPPPTTSTRPSPTATPTSQRPSCAC